MEHTDLDRLAVLIRDLVMSGYSLVSWSRLPERHRNKWRNGAAVAMRQYDEHRSIGIWDIHDAITADTGPAWTDRPHHQCVRWLDAAPLIRAEVRRIHDATPARRTARTVRVAMPQLGTTRPTLRERLAERKAG